MNQGQNNLSGQNNGDIFSGQNINNNYQSQAVNQDLNGGQPTYNNQNLSGQNNGDIFSSQNVNNNYQSQTVNQDLNGGQPIIDSQDMNQSNQQTMNLVSNEQNISYQNMNNNGGNINVSSKKKPLKNNKIILIVGIVLGVVVITLGLVFLLGKNVDKISGGDDINDAMESKEFEFVFDIDSITDEWWNLHNHDFLGVNYSNKDTYNQNFINDLGNPYGKLSIQPLGFSQKVEIGYDISTKKSDKYLMEIKDNDFLLWQQIKSIDDHVNMSSSILNFYVLGNDLQFYQIRFSVEKNPKNIELTKGTWNVIDSSAEGYVTIDAYYPINSDRCFYLDFPGYTSNPNKLLDDKSDVEKLVKKVTSLITFTEITDETNDDEFGFLSVSLDDIKLDEKTVFHVSTMKIVSWHGGHKDIVGHNHDGYAVLSVYNNSGNRVNITEFTSVESRDETIKKANEILLEYIYKGRKIYIVTYPDDVDEYYKGKYNSIMFEANGFWYNVGTWGSVNSAGLDVNNWIDTMISGVFSLN